jgi:hypothetical protein
MDNWTHLHVHFILNHQTLDAHEGRQFFFIFVQAYTYGQTQKSPANKSHLHVHAKLEYFRTQFLKIGCEGEDL